MHRANMAPITFAALLSLFTLAASQVYSDRNNVGNGGNGFRGNAGIVRNEYSSPRTQNSINGAVHNGNQNGGVANFGRVNNGKDAVGGVVPQQHNAEKANGIHSSNAVVVGDVLQLNNDKRANGIHSRGVHGDVGGSRNFNKQRFQSDNGVPHSSTKNNFRVGNNAHMGNLINSGITHGFGRGIQDNINNNVHSRINNDINQGIHANVGGTFNNGLKNGQFVTGAHSGLASPVNGKINRNLAGHGIGNLNGPVELGNSGKSGFGEQTMFNVGKDSFAKLSLNGQNLGFYANNGHFDNGKSGGFSTFSDGEFGSDFGLKSGNDGNGFHSNNGIAADGHQTNNGIVGNGFRENNGIHGNNGIDRNGNHGNNGINGAHDSNVIVGNNIHTNKRIVGNGLHGNNDIVSNGIHGNVGNAVHSTNGIVGNGLHGNNVNVWSILHTNNANVGNAANNVIIGNGLHSNNRNVGRAFQANNGIDDIIADHYNGFITRGNVGQNPGQVGNSDNFHGGIVGVRQGGRPVGVQNGIDATAADHRNGFVTQGNVRQNPRQAGNSDNVHGGIVGVGQGFQAGRPVGAQNGIDATAADQHNGFVTQGNARQNPRQVGNSDNVHGGIVGVGQGFQSGRPVGAQNGIDATAADHHNGFVTQGNARQNPRQVGNSDNVHGGIVGVGQGFQSGRPVGDQNGIDGIVADHYNGFITQGNVQQNPRQVGNSDNVHGGAVGIGSGFQGRRPVGVQNGIDDIIADHYNGFVTSGNNRQNPQRQFGNTNNNNVLGVGQGFKGGRPVRHQNGIE